MGQRRGPRLTLVDAAFSPAERATMKAPGRSVVVGSLYPGRNSFPIFGRRRRHRDRQALSGYLLISSTASRLAWSSGWRDFGSSLSFANPPIRLTNLCAPPSTYTQPPEHPRPG